MEQIATSRMIGILDEVRGAEMVGFIAVTNPYSSGKPLQKARDAFTFGKGENARIIAKGDPNPFVDADGCHLVKVQRGHAMFNCKYNKAVEKRVAESINSERAANGEPPLEGEALTEAIDARFRKGENWQELVLRDDGTLTPFAAHRDTGEKYLRTMFYKPVGEVVLIDRRDGTMYTPTDLANILPTKSENKNQGLSSEKVVRYNVWKLEGIRGMRLNGTLYRVRPKVELEAEAVFAALNERLAAMDIPEPPSMDEATA